MFTVSQLGSPSDGYQVPDGWTAPALPKPQLNLVAPTVDLFGDPFDYAMVTRGWDAVRLAVAWNQSMETLTENQSVLQGLLG